MERLKEKLDFLLDKYSVGEKVILKDRKTALFGGKEVPLLPHRAEKRYIELRNIVTGGTLEGVSMMKCECVAKKTSGVYDVLRREADIASFVLGRRIKSVAAAENENTLNAIAKTEDGVVIIFEIAAKAKSASTRSHQDAARRAIFWSTHSFIRTRFMFSARKTKSIPMWILSFTAFPKRKYRPSERHLTLRKTKITTRT